MSVSKLLDQGGGFWRFGAICNSAHYSAKRFRLRTRQRPGEPSGLTIAAHPILLITVKNRAAPAYLNSRPNAVLPHYFCSKWLKWAVLAERAKGRCQYHFGVVRAP